MYFTITERVRLSLIADLKISHRKRNINSSQNSPLTIKLLKDESAEKAIPQSSIELLRAMKVNQYQFNALIKKAPYNWVAAFGGFKAI